MEEGTILALFVVVNELTVQEVGEGSCLRVSSHHGERVYINLWNVQGDSKQQT
jgi:hypothetical protein